MSKLENAQGGFTETDFVSMIIPLLREEGITKINKSELERKLYYYYLKEEYKELFQDIVPFRALSASDGMLNIENGLTFNKIFDCIKRDFSHPEELILIKIANLDLSFYEQYLTEDGVQKIYQMAKEFGVRHKVERYAKTPLSIFANDPNHSFFLGVGTYYDEEYSWQMVTDGDIKKIETYENLHGGHYFQDPERPNDEILLRNSQVTSVEIENANYVLMQGTRNEEIKRLKAYTDLLGLDELNQIANIDINDCLTMNAEKPYVRKYILK